MNVESLLLLVSRGKQDDQIVSRRVDPTSLDACRL